ncbi:AraC-like DNA-binding protein [Spirosoma sp. LMG 31448]|uniref:AraC-like DNA-binding protein n=1 Tax=Spirosoma utsteinense TaxID=2585773 RepID=A0ABR6WBE2_9BACT|nr:helix-turn-helix domain-containing protein [Spirosoma utsteinense]MBC3787675.1 AraC-like DNA-binding protein [Spirosoma utsteinense]MBC3793272.1 AraC-like DNA-binding protein [Spirosoma utsteinense]
MRHFIKGYHLRHFRFADVASPPLKPYAPRPDQQMAFYPRGRELVEHIAPYKLIQRPRSMITGQYTERTNRLLTGQDFLVLLVDFQPGVLYRITGIPFYELTNTFIDAEAVFGREIRLVNERLASSDDYPEMINIVERFLTGLVGGIKRNSHPLDSITSLLIERPEKTSIIQLAEATCLCPRQFERLFNKRMGVAPKLFSRIARLHNAYRIKYTRPTLDWLSIALACGYHDYQHLAKDFQRFAGTTPNNYAREDGMAPERLFGMSDSSYT